MRNSNYSNSNSVSLLERLIASATYVTMGMVGFVWLIFCAITKTNLKPFLKYHIFQSFFLVMACFLINIFINLIVSILSVIPFINILVYKLLFLFTAPIAFGFSIVSFCMLVVMVYLVLTSLQGKYTFIPWVSNIINTNVGR